MTLDPVTRAIRQRIHGAGYAVKVTTTEITAIDNKTHEAYIVRFDHHDRLYDAVVRLATQVGIDLEDG